MASKKYLCLISLLCLFSSGLFAQIGGGYDVQDSSVVPTKRLPQHSEFMSHNYAFPALPRNQWEIGLKLGSFAFASDVRSRMPGIGAALHVRKALGYVFSLRGEAGFGIAKNPAWANAYAPGGIVPLNNVYYNYKSNVYDLSLQGVVSLNNIRFHKAKTGFNVYAFGGFGGMIYDTKIDALNGSTPYNFSSIPSGGFSKRKDIKKALKSLLDGKYETTAERADAIGIRGVSQG